MKVEFFLSSDSIENSKTTLKNSAGERRFINEFYWGNVMILEGERCRHCIFLENISLIEFFYDFETSLVKHKKVQNAENLIMDMNQSYGIQVSKVKDILTFGTYSKDQGCEITSNYAHALHRVKFASQTLFKDLLYHCPEIEGLDEFEYIRKMLM